jgi:plasmid stability protein
MATLYVRNMPAELYAELQQWANEHERSLNAEVIDLLRRAVAERRRAAEQSRSLAAYFERYRDAAISVPDVVDLIREGREREWLDEYKT